MNLYFVASLGPRFQQVIEHPMKIRDWDCLAGEKELFANLCEKNSYRMHFPLHLVASHGICVGS